MRCSCALALWLVASAVASAAHATDEATKADCLAAHEASQSHRNAGKLRDARRDAETCARTECPRLVIEDCARWATELEPLIPTLVFEARGPGGTRASDVHVLFDGAPLVAELDGRAVAVDPGEHVLRFERPGTRGIEQKIVVLEGDRARRVQVEFPAAVAPPRPSGSPPDVATRPVPTAVWLLTGVSAAAFGSFAYFGLTGLDARGELVDKHCKPSCPEDEVDATFVKLLAADISLGVALVSLGVASALYFSRPEVRASLKGRAGAAGRAFGLDAAGLRARF